MNTCAYVHRPASVFDNCRILVWLTVAATLPLAVARSSTASDWKAAAQRQVADAEYRVTWQSTTPWADVGASWQAPNRAQGFRAWFTEDGVQVVPRTVGEPAWEMGLKLTRYGRASRDTAVPAAVPSVEGARVEYLRGAVAEWYVNDPRGLQQGFTLAAPPDGVGREPIHLILELTGELVPRGSPDGRTLELATFSGRRVLRYAQLAARDADGNRIRAWMEGFTTGNGRGIRISVDDAGAEYPITIDPLLTGPAWSVDGQQAEANLGESVATAGDVNGDGYSDVLMGAPGFDGGHLDEGRVYVFLGSASGPGESPAWTAELDQAGARFGDSVGTAGDVNGDGYSDVVVGASSWTNGQAGEGGAWVYLGSPSGLAPTPTWHAESEQTGAAFGISAGTAGDVNGDGYSDVIVGATRWTSGKKVFGRVYVYLGSPSGLSAAAAWTGVGDQDAANFGVAVGTAGDVNGDGYSDAIIGADSYDNHQTDEGRAYAFYGSASGLPSVPSWIVEPDLAGARLGISAGTAGDVNGDGYADVIVGASGYGSAQANEGRALVFLGSPSGLATAAAWTAESGQAEAGFGSAVATAGDLNADGYADVIVTAPGFDNGETDEGRAYVYRGSASGLETVAYWSAESDQVGAQLGRSAGTAGDVNGDGISDLILGAPSYGGTYPTEGRVLVYDGATSGPSTSPITLDPQYPTMGQNFGFSVAVAGDVNGDGHADVIAGIPDDGFPEQAAGTWRLYLGSASGLSTSPVMGPFGANGEGLGYSVSAAGDVNGDGYGDVIVGSYGGNHAFVHAGSAAGISITPSWTLSHDGGLGGFGESVSAAGDVNGDGYADVIVSAPLYANGQYQEGRAYLYLGGASGPSTSPAWVAEGNQIAAHFGSSVSTAGDVNGDGYSDVIVGAPGLGRGSALVYLGTPSGLARDPAWTATWTDFVSLEFGNAVSTAGDVNGDGYSDVIVGHHRYFHLSGNEGRAYVYHGSSYGLSSTPSWIVRGRFAGDRFGRSVSSAGDVNGDGYSDVIAGAAAINGRAEVYLGSASGLAASPAWELTGSTSGASFGASVAGAGDTNGDGYSEIVVGSPGAGSVVVYEGNGGRGRSVALRQRRSDGTAPIASLGASDSESSFRLAATGRTPFGRGKVKLEWEVKPLGAPFDGSGIARSASWFDTAHSGAAIEELATGLPAGTPHHWRLRVVNEQAATPFQALGRWFSPSWNGWLETDLRTGGGATVAGSVPDGDAIPGEPLRLGKAGQVDLTLEWGASCLASDSDYSVYEGALHDFTSHTPKLCTTGGLTTAIITPADGNRYYLVVPRNATREGSYGTTSMGAQRQPSFGACLPQAIGSCP